MDETHLRDPSTFECERDYQLFKQGWDACVADMECNANLNLERLERWAIDRALERHDGNRTQAAKELGINIRTLQRKLARAAVCHASQNCSDAV
jgi:DNA-binding NtrC family response regulator